MKIFIDHDYEKEHDASTITIRLSEDIDIRISVNKFGEVVINKAQFGVDDGAINIKPSVSNEIRIK